MKDSPVSTLAVSLNLSETKSLIKLSSFSASNRAIPVAPLKSFPKQSLPQGILPKLCLDILNTSVHIHLECAKRDRDQSDSDSVSACASETKGIATNPPVDVLAIRSKRASDSWIDSLLENEHDAL